MAYDFLVHHEGDSVGVLVRDVKRGERLKGGLLEGCGYEVEVTALQDIPLSHKISTVKVESQGEIIEYGRQIGQAIEEISPGDWVHVHNVRSVRWSG